MSKFTNVFPLVCGTNFYKQCVPDDTCDIIVSTFATHYLSEDSHVRCSNTMFPWRSTSEEEVQAHHEAAARDWQTFLLLRAAELKQGGLLFVLMPAKSTANVSCTRKETAKDIWTNFDLLWNEFYAKGLITREEFQSCTIAMALRTLQEIKAPFENAILPVPQAGLNLLKEPEELITSCYAKTMWRQNLKTHGVDDKNLFARLLAKGFSVVINGTLRNTFRNTRSAEEQSEILKDYYECFTQKLALANPETFQSELFVSRLVAQKLK
ncbi:uncharacterized protein LOC112574929 [Pomacea canaliculata]|uniref:uncharacterized protein LOC112574929 n=1 Tax=Pomacea canaliculata TaxID=400727 RepID=UPI000D7268F7|nr:uncharacterized protein LOC112574929 [Pomacea canaliculata]